jgi:hypothetical protein
MITQYFFKLEEQIGQPYWPSSHSFLLVINVFFVFASFIVLVIMNLCQWSLVIGGFVLLVQAL